MKSKRTFVSKKKKKSRFDSRIVNSNKHNLKGHVLKFALEKSNDLILFIRYMKLLILLPIGFNRESHVI